MKAYLEISVEKELPKDAGQHFVLEQGDKKYGIGGIQRKHVSYVVPHTVGRGLELKPSHDHYKVTHWLREFSLPELMEEFARVVINNEWNHENKDEEQLVNDFLSQKGIL